MHIVLELNCHVRNVIIKKQNGSLKRQRMVNHDCAKDLTFCEHYSDHLVMQMQSGITPKQ